MASHEFGIMDRTPERGERYDEYQPEKYHCIVVDDEWIEPILSGFDQIDFFWHTLDVPGKGLAYCGITLIPPESVEATVSVIEGTPELLDLKRLFMKAKAEGKYVIHYGL